MVLIKRPLYLKRTDQGALAISSRVVTIDMVCVGVGGEVMMNSCSQELSQKFFCKRHLKTVSTDRAHQL